MAEWLRDILSIWGAALSTTLAGAKLVSFIRDRAIVDVTAEIAYQGATEPQYGTRIVDPRTGAELEIYVAVTITNRGRRPVQVVSIYVAHATGAVQQVLSTNLPTVIEPGHRVETRLQKEWFDESVAIDFGVLDGLGNRHPFGAAANLFKRSRGMPTERRQYQKKTIMMRRPFGHGRCAIKRHFR